jgi:glycosyltransferase involved in cell wall biosynthesis
MLSSSNLSSYLMNIVFFAHPTFLGYQSMPRFAHMLVEGMQARGHQVSLWTPAARWCRLPAPAFLRKWLGYIDQYIVFPTQVRQSLKTCTPDTLFVFADQALGPWVPIVSNRPHVIHCHDFLAQYAALDQIPEVVTSWSGKQYQAYIRQGYACGQNFISVSQKTRYDLHQFLPALPLRSEVVYNGFNQVFESLDPVQARAWLSEQTGLDLQCGYLLHVGGNQWYKNRRGVVELYNAWRTISQPPLPLLLIGEHPDTILQQAQAQSPYKSDIKLLTGVENKVVRWAYAGATVFLFPSLAEGFGWPIAEAMAAGCPVVTTQEAPMTEVGAAAAFYIPRRPANDKAFAWAAASAQVVQQVVALGETDRQIVVDKGRVNARRFETTGALHCIEAIYQEVLQAFEKT